MAQGVAGTSSGGAALSTPLPTWHPVSDRESMPTVSQPRGPSLSSAWGTSEVGAVSNANVLVTLPVYNEERLLYGSVRALITKLDSAGLRYTLSIAEDGSTDGTLEIVRGLQKEFPAILAQTDPQRLGRGLALRKFWAETPADVYLFVDADLAAGPAAVLAVLRELGNGADVVTGSRYCPGAIVRRPGLRKAASLGYNWIVRRMFHEPIRDHQCGLKAFTREALSRLLEASQENSWAWDTEILVLAQMAGLRVREVPVEWTEHRSVRTPLPRLASDIYLHGTALLRLKSRVMRASMYRGRRDPGGRGAQSSAPAPSE